MSNEQTEALKSCPFCGGGATLRDTLFNSWFVAVEHTGSCAMNGAAPRYWEAAADAIAAWNTRATPSPAPSDTQRAALTRMVELDEEIEAANPGWMTDGPTRYRAIAAELTEALAKRDTDRFRAIAFKERHHIIAALGGSHD